jgi:hypothetical protein
MQNLLTSLILEDDIHCLYLSPKYLLENSSKAKIIFWRTDV